MPAAELPASIAGHAQALVPISLETLQATAPLRTRLDRKYVVSEATAARLVQALGVDHRILEIDGRRSFEYRSTYFDSDSLGAFRAHVQGRRRRYKCRTRHYVDSDHVVFEVKLKGARGETIKHQLPLDTDLHGTVPPAARVFADKLLHGAYGQALPTVEATIHTRYRRLTLAAADASSRITFDFDVRFTSDDGKRASIQDGFVIVETKSERGASRADQLLKELGERPADCSKYCLGVGLLRDDVRANALLWLMRRYFTPSHVRTPSHAT